MGGEPTVGQGVIVIVNQKEKTYIVIDFEATCCNQGSFPRSEMEIIEFGVVAVASRSLSQNPPGLKSVSDEFQAFVRPKRNPKLTRFCHELTTIRQSDVDSANEFPEVLSHFSDWLCQFSGPVFCSWGDYDRSS